MWKPRYIDMNPHFSQNILNKGIFRMWIHRYIDMYLDCLDNSFLSIQCDFFSQLTVYIGTYPHLPVMTSSM